MQKRKSLTALLFVCLFASVILQASVVAGWSFSEDWIFPEEGLAIELNSPANNSVITNLTCSFNYTALLFGNDTFYASSLYVNNAPVAFNQTAIQNNTLSSINYTFAENGVYAWTVQVWNSTSGVFAVSNFTVIVNAPLPTVAPTPIPTITPATANSDFNLITIFTTIFSVGFFILGIYEGIGKVGDIDFARATIFYIASLLSSILCIGLYLSMSTPFAVAYWGIPVFIIIMNIVLVVFTSWKAYLHKMEVTPSRNRRYNPNEE
jgi:lipid-A-disaccharide synthase-like uncharacterized protein